MAELMRIIIPSGWVVIDNKFYDTEPIKAESNNAIINWHEGFIEDVLWIQECEANIKGQYTIPQYNHFNIDLSWLPDSDINGFYCAKLNWCGQEDMTEIETLESKNCYDVRSKIENWMIDIKNPNSKYQEWRKK